MAEKLVSEILKTLLHEVRSKGLKTRKRQDGGIIIYAGKKKVIIILEEENEL